MEKSIGELLRRDRISGFYSAAAIAWNLLLFASLTGSSVFIINSLGWLHPLSWVSYLVALIVVPVLQLRLGALGHEAAHEILFRNKLANELISDVFCMLPLFTSTNKYRTTHGLHHLHVGNPERDPNARRIKSLNQFIEKLGHRPIKGRIVWHPVVIAKYLFDWAREYSGLPESDKSKNHPINSFYQPCVTALHLVAVVLILTVFNLWSIILLFWVVPLVTIFPVLMIAREMVEHPIGSNVDRYQLSTNVKAGLLSRLFVYPYGLDFHLVHHLYPCIGYRDLSTVNKALMNDNRRYQMVNKIPTQE